MENAQSLVIGMIKQSVLKQVKKKGGGEWVQAKFYIGERGDSYCNDRIFLSFLLSFLW